MKDNVKEIWLKSHPNAKTCNDSSETDELMQKKQEDRFLLIALEPFFFLITIICDLKKTTAAGSDEADPAEARQRNPISLSFCCTQTG